MIEDGSSGWGRIVWKAWPPYPSFHSLRCGWSHSPRSSSKVSPPSSERKIAPGSVPAKTTPSSAPGHQLPHAGHRRVGVLGEADRAVRGLLPGRAEVVRAPAPAGRASSTTSRPAPGARRRGCPRARSRPPPSRSAGRSSPRSRGRRPTSRSTAPCGCRPAARCPCVSSISLDLSRPLFLFRKSSLGAPCVKSPADLPATSFALLGLLTFGDELTGYELKQRADMTLRFYWTAPAMSQVYTELSRLLTLGLVATVGDGRTTRYRITEAGQVGPARLDGHHARRLPGAQAPGGAAVADGPRDRPGRGPLDAGGVRRRAGRQPRGPGRGAGLAGRRGRARRGLPLPRRWWRSGGWPTSTPSGGSRGGSWPGSTSSRPRRVRPTLRGGRSAPRTRRRRVRARAACGPRP